MNRRFAYIVAMMAFALLMFILSIEYAKRHPITEAEIAAQRAERLR